VTHGISLAIEFEEEAEAKQAPDTGRASVELADVEANLERVRARLANPGFTDKAPAAVVEGARRQLVELEQKRARLAGARGAESSP
jgi:valyl-tRNA synthetase